MLDFAECWSCIIIHCIDCFATLAQILLADFTITQRLFVLIYFSLLSSDLSPTEVQNDHMILCLDLLDCDSHMGLTKKVIDRYGKVSQQLLKNEYL